MRTAQQTTIAKVSFELKLPPLFDIKPAYEIELPAKRAALVYDIKIPNPERDSRVLADVSQTIPAWRVVVVTGKGRFVDRYSNSRGERGTVFTDPLLLALHIQGLVQELTKTKVTTVEESEALDD